MNAEADKTMLHIEYVLVYVSPVNRFAKSCIEHGAQSGMSKNFSQMMGALGQRVKVQDAAQARIAAIDTSKVRRSVFCNGLFLT